MIAVMGWLLFAFWAIVVGIPTLWFVGRSLQRQSDRVPEIDDWPLLSVVVPARDEGHKIEAGLKSLLDSDYPRFEIIAIDDRSRDETGTIMDRLANQVAADSAPNSRDQGHDPRQRSLHVIHITDLPEGWLGKNHALHRGSQSAAGTWILFTDGDVVYQRDTLRRAVRYAEGRHLDHLPLFPNIEAMSIFEAAFVACFAMIFAAGTQPGLVSTRFRWFYVGVGAFNLVRRSALDRAGGFRPIQFDIMDDVKLGKLLKQTGSRSDVLRAGPGLSVRWQRSTWGCITGLEKNAFASADYSLARLTGILLVTAVVFVGPLAGSILGGEARYGYIAALALSHVIYGLNAQLFGHSFWVFPGLIPSGLAFLFAYLRSGWITLRQQGVYWRGTFYPLGVLRQHIYQGQ